MLYALIGTKLNNFNIGGGKGRGWAELSEVDKVELVASGVFVGLTVAILGVFGVVIRRKLKEYKECHDIIGD